MRLHVYLSRCGIGSRRKCEQFIADGKVTVDGVTVHQMGIKVNGDERITFSGRYVKPIEKAVYLALHKPPGYLCSASDPYGRPLAYELFHKAVNQRLFHVGRLDYNTEGLIFFTNDGRFAEIITHPSYGIEKEYQVRLAERVPERLLMRYKSGLRLGDERIRLKEYRYVDPQSVLLTLTEGKNREIRTFFSNFGIGVKQICRTRVGIVKLRGIGLGRYRFLTRWEMKWFLSRQNVVQRG